MMQDVFEKLRTLQDILSKKFEIEQNIKDIPKALSTKTELLNRLKKSYIEKNEKYDETKSRIKSLKNKMIEAEQSREKYEGQMDLIKTQREYEALDREIRDASEKEQNLRKEIQKEEKNIEEMEHILLREESMIKEQEEELQTEQNKIKSESEKKKTVLKTLEKEEKTIIPGLNEDMLFKFERIIKSKAGVGIVPLKGGVCTGCHMILSHQFVNDVRLGEGVLFCPYCSRILFFEEAVDEDTFFDSDSEGLADLTEGDEDFLDEE
jgi:uncharacterized protein